MSGTSAIPQPTHDVAIGDGRVCAWDQLLPAADLALLNAIMEKSSYTRTESARPDTDEYRHWVVEIAVEIARTMPFYPVTMRALQQFSPQRKYQLYRCYVNVSTYGDMLFTHTDCVPGAGELTGLWYICERWDPEWGGETLFFDQAMDVRAAIQPRPGRFSVFNGEITHVGRPPNRNCHLSRFTLAMKFEPIG